MIQGFVVKWKKRTKCTGRHNFSK